MSPNDADGMANSVDPDQTTPLGAVWSGCALFAQAYQSENLGSLQYFLSFFSLPAVMVQSLLTEFLKVTMDISPDAAKYTDLHFDVLSEEAAFAAQLYHRW